MGAEETGVPRAAAWLAPPLMGAAGLFLSLSILQLIRLGQRSQLFSVPLAAEQTVEFPAPGTVAMSIEGPRGTSRFSGLTYELASKESGARVEMRPVYLRLHVSGLATARLEIARWAIPRAGRYILKVSGLGAAAAGLEGHRLAFGTPSTLATAGWIVGIVLSASALIGGLVLLILALTGAKAGP